MKPVLFNLFGWPLFSYPLFMGLGWGIGYNSVHSFWNKFHYKEKELKTLFLGVFIFAWILAKVFFLAFSAPNKAYVYSAEINFWLGGGFVFYGGAIGGVLFSCLFLFFKKELELHALNLMIPGLCLGHGIGRLGCFLAGCCYGAETNMPLSIHMHGADRHPVQLYEAIGLFIIYIFSKRSLLKEGLSYKPMLIYLSGYSVLRFCLEFLRGDLIRGIHYGLSSSQWLSIVVAIVAVVIAVKKSMIPR